MHFLFFQKRKVETEKHFILECEAFKDNSESYANPMAASSWAILFSKGFVKKLRAFILKLHKKKVEYIKQIKKQSVQQSIFIFVLECEAFKDDMTITSFK